MAKRIRFKHKTVESFVDAFYPVGSIYISVNSVNPNTLFGGTWERIQGRFLLAADDTNYVANSIGGEANHTLTVNEMPSHTHTQNSHNHNIPYRNDSGPYDISIHFSYDTDNAKTWWNSSISTDYAIAINQNTGGGQAHNNMPPYLAVYMWKRVS